MACLHLQRLSQPISALPIIFHPVLRTQLTLPPGLNFQARIIAGFSLFAPNVGVLSSKLSSPHYWYVKPFTYQARQYFMLFYYLPNTHTAGCPHEKDCFFLFYVCKNPHSEVL